MKSFSILILLLYIQFNESVQAQVYKTMKHLPGTGQLKSYTNTFGENADYNVNPPGFLLHGNGTLTDTVTGLMWQQMDGGEMTYANAKLFVDTLTLGGYTNWRLPNAHEAFSILNHDATNPAMDLLFWTKTAAEYWWSSDQQVGDPSKVWCTNAGGGIGNHPIAETVSAGGSKKFHVRAVRDVQMPNQLSAHFVAQANGSIYDSLTSLYWLPMLSSDTLTWEQALNYSEQLTWGGYSDWRLPNIKELQSINIETSSNPSLNTTFFSQIGTKFIWSSTSLPNQTSKAWYLDTKFGITTYKLKTNRIWTICVRGGYPNNSTLTNIDVSNFRVFPNPCEGRFHIESASPIGKVELYNGLGVIYCRIQTDQNTLLLDQIPAGLYTLKMTSAGSISFRVISVF